MQSIPQTLIGSIWGRNSHLVARKGQALSVF